MSFLPTRRRAAACLTEAEEPFFGVTTTRRYTYRRGGWVGGWVGGLSYCWTLWWVGGVN